MKTGIREPIVAGAFYPARREELASVVTSLFSEEIDRRCVPLPDPCGLIVPHAGYPYSGPTAAAAFRFAAAQGRPEVVILLGANHSGFGGPVALDDHAAWRTPLGDMPIDHELVEKLARGGMAIDRSAFLREHSIEVQLPFLQVLWGSTVPILPICIQSADLASLTVAAEAVAGTLRAVGSPLLVASSDFTHYEPDPVARRLDHAALEPILALDAVRFLRLCVEERLSICGAGAIAILMLVARELGMVETTLVHYATSGDTTGDRAAVVGYAAVSFLRRDHG